MDGFTQRALKGEPFEGALVFDCHGHFGPEAGFFIPGADTGAFLAVLDRVGIDRVAISTFANGLPYGNDVVAQAIASHPDRFVGWVRVNANYPELMERELARCTDDSGFRGIKVHPYCDQIPADDPRYEPVWRFSAEQEVPVLIHTWNSRRYTDALLETCRPGIFEKIALEHPGAVLLLGHSGGEWDGIADTLGVAKKCPNIFLDTASSRLYPGIIERLIEELGAERILYGSDVPFLSPVPQIGKIVAAEIGEKEKRMILGGNAARLFGMEKGN